MGSIYSKVLFEYLGFIRCFSINYHYRDGEGNDLYTKVASVCMCPQLDI